MGICEFDEDCGLLKVLVNDFKISEHYRSRVRTVVIDDSVTRIGESAFFECTSLISVTLPDSVTFIGDYAFAGCTSLISVTLPDAVRVIGDYAFSGCTSMIQFNVGASNYVYSSEEGILFNKNKTVLIQYPAGKTVSSYAIPDSVKSIGNCAFVGCTFLTSIVIPGSVKTIGFSAFHGCTFLTLISISGSVESIKYGAFKECTALKEVIVLDNADAVFIEMIKKVVPSGCRFLYDSGSVNKYRRT